MLAEIEIDGWTEDKTVRHGTFKRQRDKADEASVLDSEKGR